MADFNFGSSGGTTPISNLNPAGALLAGQGAATTANAPILPWEQSAVRSRFFASFVFDGSRWDQLFPYRLLVIDALNDNKVVNGKSPDSITTTVSPGTSSAIVTYVFRGAEWIFQLPITPQSLRITDQFAINTTATLRGVTEEHSGVRFKMINAAGTMGVWTGRDSVVAPPASPSVISSLFGGTISAAQGLVGQAQGLINTIKTGHPGSAPTTKRPEDIMNGTQTTGLYQGQALQQFLEQYAEAKRDPRNAGWRLVFDIPKQNQSFVVTPMAFNWIQNANKPMEISYTFQLKAWRRIDLKQAPTQVPSSIQKISPGVLAKILNSITQARSVCSSAINLIGAVRSDVEAPLNALRQTALLVKDLMGVATTAADLPFQLQKDYSSSLKESLNIATTNGNFAKSDAKTVKAIADIKDSSQQVEGLSMTAVQGGQLGTSAAQAQSIDPANNVFSNPAANFDLMDQVNVNDLTLSPTQQLAVQNVIDEAREITTDDLRGFRATIQTLALQLSNNFGAGSEFYSEVYGLPAPTPRIQPMTLDEYDILKTLYDTLQGYDILTATTDIDYLNKQTNMDYVAGLAQSADIEFQTSTSKILAPVPFGLTVEAIALRYLGDPQRWLEIVTLNNLKEPYIDENGFKLTLLSNATGRQITVSSINNLFVGQRVLMQSSTQAPSARQILDIDALSATSFLITLDGLANLDNYITADLAYLQAYLPGTVNSQQKIFIPSDLPVPNDANIVNPPVAAKDPLTGMSKVDLLLTETGDLALNNFGDIRLAYGITNIIQAIKIKVGTVRGSLITHPEFGLGVKVGVMNSELNTTEMFTSMNQMIKSDPRFQGLSSLQITINGGILSINMGVILAGQRGVFPLNFNLVA